MMDEQNKELQEFDLDAILKEFGSGEPEREQEAFPEEEAVSEQEEELILEFSDTLVFENTEELPFEDGDVLLWEGEATQQPVQESVSQDTVRLDELSHVLHKQSGQPDAELAQEDVGVPAEPPVEPFSEKWEPDYEQPMGEYIPPEPIIFRPRSRLQELKRKLVAGPEKRYYELVELGLGKLQFAILLSLVISALAIGATVMHALDMVPAERLKLLVFWQFFSLLLSAMFGSYQLLGGMADLFRRRFSLDTLLVFSFLACLLDGILCLQQQRIPCCAPFSLNVTMSLWAAYHRRNTEMGQMDTMRKAIRLDSVVSVPDYYEGRPGLLRGEGQVEDFMDNYDVPGGPEKTMSIYALVALFAGIGIGVTAGVLHGLNMGLQAFSAALLVAVPASAYVTLSRPAAILERRLHKLGAVLCGWQGVWELSRPAVFPLKDEDLFPSSTVKVNGVKFYGQRDPDEVVAYAAALMSADGDGTAPLFTQLLDSRSGNHYEATSLQYYPGGLGGIVNGEAVLMGILPFMQDMGVDMPEGTRVNQAVYAAIDGQLCGVFAVSYTKSKSAAAGLTTLCAYRKLTPVLITGDFMLTESFLRGKFGINIRKLAFPERALRRELAGIEPEEESVSLALTTGEDLAGAAFAVTGARALRIASVTGVVVHMIGGILGLLMMLVLTLVGADYLLTPVNLMLYELIWLVPGLLITEWTRSV